MLHATSHNHTPGVSGMAGGSSAAFFFAASTADFHFDFVLDWGLWSFLVKKEKTNHCQTIAIRL